MIERNSDKVKNYLLLEVKESEEDPTISNTEMSITSPFDFIMAFLMTIKCLSVKSGIPYPVLLELFGDALKHELIVDQALDLVRQELDPDILM